MSHAALDVDELAARLRSLMELAPAVEWPVWAQKLVDAQLTPEVAPLNPPPSPSTHHTSPYPRPAAP